jgi:hypothetical protein
VQDGNFAQLIEQNGLFFQLYELQSFAQKTELTDPALQDGLMNAVELEPLDRGKSSQVHVPLEASRKTE